ncbi:ABC transporter permease [Marinactinospora thermotolerans]|uniref:Transport permease protein n=1 Tax=Marinactinospora thermotolerans DSM 45154 TaxID=1122192 RepID=A0A1T4QN23_9ACTN|nr:ABC transporter permease [Marinactinospora thermotolerans]SKA05163.1 ABC-2 type transport system permease protein [Marinactinospora thermotolerans DSM 45154]
MASRALAVWQNRQVVNLLVRRELKVKYQKSILGYAWSLLDPLAQAAIYFFVFGVLFNARVAPGGEDAPGGYALFLLSGILPWMWMSTALNDASRALITHAKLITTMKVPREIFPLAVVQTKFIEYLLTWPVLLLFVIVLGGQTGWTLLWLPVAIAVQFVFTLGITLFLASLNVLLRDVQRIVRILNRVLFYSSPIIYPMFQVMESERIPGWFKTLYEMNPLVGIFQMHHAVWFPTEQPTQFILWSTVAGALIMFVIGYLTFRRLETAVLKEL